MKKSIIFTILAMLVYLLTNILMGVFARQLGLIKKNEIENSFVIKDKFHHLNVNVEINGYCRLNITEGFSPKINFENVYGNKSKTEHFVKNDTLFVIMGDTAANGYQPIDITTGRLASIKISSNNETNVSVLSRSGVLLVLLKGNVSYSQYNSRIDTLNILEGNARQISLDSCEIGYLNIYNKNKKINLNISRSPLPVIRQLDEDIITKPSE
jgi:hypothetical protein